MRDAIDHLARTGRNDLASDLSRISAKVDFEELEVLRCPGTDRLADAILETESFSEFASILGRIAKAMSFQHCTLHVISESATTNFVTKVITTYPSAWVTRYVERRYSAIDPVGRVCVSASHGFFWGDLPRSSPLVDAFWKDFAAHGLGIEGYTQPIVTERGDKLALTVCSRMDAERFRHQIDRYEADLASLGIILSEAFCRLASENRPASFSPSDDQLLALRALAMGADEAELRQRSYQTGPYEVLARSICELFRTRTVAAAAVLAARIGLLNDAPLSKSEVLTIAPDEVGQADLSLPMRRLARMRNFAAVDRSDAAAEMGD